MAWARGIEHAPKLVVLKQLLEDCGIGLTTDAAAATAASDTPAAGHRVRSPF